MSRRPQWELSCYGVNTSWEHGRNVVNGDMSFEELRLEAYVQYSMCGSITGYLENLARARAEKSLVFKRLVDDPAHGAAIARMPHRAPGVVPPTISVPPAIPQSVVLQQPMQAQPPGQPIFQTQAAAPPVQQHQQPPFAQQQMPPIQQQMPFAQQQMPPVQQQMPFAQQQIPQTQAAMPLAQQQAPLFEFGKIPELPPS